MTGYPSPLRSGIVALALAGAALWSTPVNAQFLAFAPAGNPNSMFREVLPDQSIARGDEEATEMSPRFRRQVVDYPTREAAGTIVIDTPNTFLYYVLGNGKAIRYGIGVGRDGFTWAGVKSIERKSEWPDWYPPAEMIERQPYLPRMMSGGPGNPLGARAMYLGGTHYRIHGTNQPATIGKHVSSGCIRMLNEDVTDLYERAKIGTKVVVLPDLRQRISANEPAANAGVPRGYRGVY
jgi:lipoprotein-anchoring transpeptidase ErfK/SrfK